MESVREAMDSGETEMVSLRDRVPVRVIYYGLGEPYKRAAPNGTSTVVMPICGRAWASPAADRRKPRGRPRVYNWGFL